MGFDERKAVEIILWMLQKALVSANTNQILLGFD